MSNIGLPGCICLVGSTWLFLPGLSELKKITVVLNMIYLKLCVLNYNYFFLFLFPRLVKQSSPGQLQFCFNMRKKFEKKENFELQDLKV